MTAERLLRAIAIAIALLALLDPALTRRRTVDREVAVLAAPVAPGAGGLLDSLTEEIVRAVDADFDPVQGVWPGAAATVLVGEGMPVGVDALTHPVFRVVASDALHRPRLVRIDAPAAMPLDGVAHIRVLIALPDTIDPGAALPSLTLAAEGAALDEAPLQPVPGTGDLALAQLSFTPTSGGVHTLAVTLSGAPAALLALPVIEVVDRRWSVLFLDSRPSWSSTFVRRSLESDPRFRVAGRVEVAPDVATTFGSPPADLSAPGALDGYDVVVVGSPDGLTASRAQLLDGWVRLGGSLLLLPDEAPVPGAPSAAWERLAGVDDWMVEHSDSAHPLSLTLPESALDDTPALLSRDRSLASPLPPGASAWIHDAAARPLVWARPLGEGRVVVSGAHDAWEFRSPEQSGFAATWATVVAQAASLVPPALELHLRPAGLQPTQPSGTALQSGLAVAPGAAVRLSLVPRLEATGTGAATAIRARASLEVAGEEPRPLTPWPTPTPGVFEAEFRAPSLPGIHWLDAEALGHTARLPLVVDERADRVAPAADPSLLRGWSAGTGGELFEATDTEALIRSLERAVDRRQLSLPWHPMRSPWWLLPFAVALAAEWGLRRRRGLP